MRRLIVGIGGMVSIVALLALGVGAASASAKAARRAAVAAPLLFGSGETDNVACLGNGGYESGTWKFQETRLEVPTLIPFIGGPQGLCKIVSPDNYPIPPELPTTELPLLQIVEPSSYPSLEEILEGPKKCLQNFGVSLNLVLCNRDRVEEVGLRSLCLTSPGGCTLLLGGLFTFLDLERASISNLTLSGTGNFKCGNGTLSGEGYSANDVDSNFYLKWTATFHNGVGTLSGTAISDGASVDDPSDFEGAEKKITGEMLIADGSVGEVEAFGQKLCLGIDTNPNQIVAVQMNISG